MTRKMGRGGQNKEKKEKEGEKKKKEMSQWQNNKRTGKDRATQSMDAGRLR